MKIYKINYHTGAGNQTIENKPLEEVMEIADKGAAYTQQNISITDENDNEVACRRWYGYDIQNDIDNDIEHENPISFGTFGFYADWVII